MESRRVEGPAKGYAFGPFVVDAVRLRLWRDGQLIPVTAKPCEVLLVLLQHRDRVVTKDELLDRVWPHATVQENNLARQIATLRRVLGRGGDRGEYIATITGTGYRFVAPADELSTLPAHRYLPAFHGDSSSAAPPPETDAAGGSTAVGSAPAVPAPLVDRPVDGRVVLGAMAGAAAAVLLTLVATSLGISGGRGADESARVLRRVTFDDAAVPRHAAWAPDGQWFVYVSDRAGSADLWKQRRGEPDAVRLTASVAVESQPAWSPDGRWIVFRSERDGGGLEVMSADGGDERRIASFGHDPAWSADGSHILFKRSVTIPDLAANHFVVALDGSAPRPLRPDVLGHFSSLYAAWHPEPNHVSIWGTRRGETGRHFMTVPIDAGEPVAAVMAAHVARDLTRLSPASFVWASSGRHLFFEATAEDTHNVWRVTVDAASGTWTDGPHRLTTGTGRESDLAIAPDGSRLLFTSTSSRTGLWAFPFDAARGRVSGQPAAVPGRSTGEVDFATDPSGQRLVYRAVRAGRHELWESRLTGGEDRLLLSSPHLQLIRPVWSPDGAQLAFSRRTPATNMSAVSVISLDGGGERVLTDPDDVQMQTYDWSGDGQFLLGPCRFREGDRYSICLISPDRVGEDASIRIVASDPARNLFNPRFSPDQRWISFLAHDLSSAAASTVYVAPATGGNWRSMTEGTWFDDKPRWGPDGRTVYFVSNRDGLANVWGRRFNPVTGVPVGDVFAVTSFRTAQFQITPRTVSMEIDVTPQHLILPMSESRSGIWMLEGADR